MPFIDTAEFRQVAAEKASWDQMWAKNEDRQPSTSISIFDTTGRRHRLPLKKRVGSCGYCLQH